MKRLLICGLAVLAMGGAANAQVDHLTLWLEDAEDGDSHIVMDGPSDTAVLQLWMLIPEEMHLMHVEAILLGYDATSGKDLCFEVAGFIDHGPWGEDPTHDGDDALGRSTRGPIEDDIPHGFLDDYQFLAQDANFPMDGYSGILGDGVTPILLDEIILHCSCINQGAPDRVYFGSGPQAPAGFELFSSPFPPPSGSWLISSLAVVDLLNGTLDNPILVENVPEPGTFGLFVLGVLTIARRRR